MKTNKQSIRKEAEASSINIYARILSSYTLGGGGGLSDRLNGFQMDRKCGLWKLCNSRWPGSVLAGRPARGPADRQERGPGVGGMLIMERGEHVWQRETMENTCPISHLFTFDCQTPARLKEEEAGGGGGEATAKVEPFKVYLFDEDANSLIAFQTFWGGKRKPWRDWESRPRRCCSGPLTKSRVWRRGEGMLIKCCPGQKDIVLNKLRLREE